MLLFCLLAHFSHLWKQMDYKHLVSVYSSLSSKNITIGCELAMVYGTQIYLILKWIRTSDRQLWDLSTTCRHDAAVVRLSLVSLCFTVRHAKLLQSQRCRLTALLYRGHSLPETLHSHTRVLYGSANWQGARMIDDWTLLFQFSPVTRILVYRSFPLHKKCHP
jgi:hypothetical protein